MTHRERLIRTTQFQPVDELPFRHAYGLMPRVLEAWHEEGLPTSVQTERDIYEYFGFQTRAKPLPMTYMFDPPFETKVLDETEEYRVELDGMGRTTKVIWASSTLPVAVDHTVRDPETWQNFKRRLVFTPDRIGPDLEKVAEQNIATGHLNSFGAMGMFWFPRDLMGDENLCIAYYEQPDWIHDILETWCGMIEQVLTAVLGRIRLDGIHFGEDMAYRNASMIGKPLFDEFMRPYYDRIRRIVQAHDVPIFSVDSDGCLNELADWFAECGVNSVGPNEVQAGNDIVEYRKHFGKTMAYDGGLDKRTLLEGRDAIDAMLERTIPFMKDTGGGWTVCLDHRVIEGTKLADFQYYVDRVREMIRFT